MIVLYSKSKKIKQLLKEIPDIELVHMTTQEEFASYIVSGSHLLCAFIHIDELTPEWDAFLSSIKRCFTLLEICLLIPPEASGFEDYKTIELNEEILAEDVESFLASLHGGDRRRHQRFDWPLTGRLVIPEKIDSQFSVRAISSTGVFLESSDLYPDPGSHGTIRIVFHDFNLLCGCKVLNKREAVGNLPSGFGIEFTDLTDMSKAIIDEIVQDELLRSLLEPDKPPRPPSIGTA